jgi:hypothetical protein
MPNYDNPDYHLVEFDPPKITKIIRGRKFVAYGYTRKPGLADDNAIAMRRLGFFTRVTHDSQMRWDVIWISSEKQRTRGREHPQKPKQPGLAVKRFKVKPIKDSHGPTGFYTVTGGKIGNTYHGQNRVHGKTEAYRIADARNRMIEKKASVIRRNRRKS